jgi:DNA-binding GntR family transcriptional regulator
MKSPVNRLSERLRESIEEEIATGKLPPGTHLDEVELATRFGVSRTPIREALILLQGEGLVDNRQRKGSVVVQVSPGRLIEMFDVMAELEAMCARLAARRATAVDLAALAAAHDQCRLAADDTDTDAYFYANESFHFALYAASHNSFLSEQATQLQRRLRPYRRLQLRVRNRLQHSFAEHQSILDALKAGDAESAVANVRKHVVVQGERFADLMASLETLVPSAAAA